MTCIVEIIWDEEAGVWLSQSTDVPIFLESESYDLLVKRLTEAIPDYLAHEKGYRGELKLSFQSAKPVTILVA